MTNKILDFSSTILALAPLAGYTDLPFRSMVKRFGVDLTVSEMISSNAMVYANKKTAKMIEKSPLENPYSVQIAGNDKEIVKKAVELLNEEDGIDIIDLNSGCPAPRITNHGSGSALLKDLKKLGEIVKIIKETSNKPMTSVKIRIGFDKKAPIDIAKACEDNGADFIAVHGRIKTQMFGGSVDYEAIGAIKRALSIPVIANGDITTPKIAKEVLDTTGADGLMIGRAAIGNPWIFYEIKNGYFEATSELKKQVVTEHLDSMIEHHGEHGILLFRKHLHTYSKGHAGASTFRERINKSTDANEIKELISEFFGLLD